MIKGLRFGGGASYRAGILHGTLRDHPTLFDRVVNPLALQDE
ncbi:MAG: hypothetical protein ABL869_07250 [Candidatus Nitrotoga sp.]